MENLAPDLHAKIEALVRAGHEAADRQDHRAALASYWAAFDLLPSPKTQWRALGPILGAIGMVNFEAGDYAAARENLSNALECSGGVSDAPMHAALGASEFELGNLDRAAEELLRGYRIGGVELFEGQDPKYINFLASRFDGIKTPN